MAATFADFAEAMADDGFAFLHQRMLDDDPGPVLTGLTVVADQRVVGAIGPMAILPDPTGCPRLLPQYFGVLPTHRGQGLGRALSRGGPDRPQPRLPSYKTRGAGRGARVSGYGTRGAGPGQPESHKLLESHRQRA